jgi:hypothetical protein
MHSIHESQTVTSGHFEGPQYLRFQGQAVKANNLSLLDHDVGATVLKSVVNYLPSDMASHPRRRKSLIWFLFFCLH